MLGNERLRGQIFKILFMKSDWNAYKWFDFNFSAKFKYLIIFTAQSFQIEAISIHVLETLQNNLLSHDLSMTSNSIIKRPIILPGPRCRNRHLVFQIRSRRRGICQWNSSTTTDRFEIPLETAPEWWDIIASPKWRRYRLTPFQLHRIWETAAAASPTTIRF